jgi:hypothetical protein
VEDPEDLIRDRSSRASSRRRHNGVVEMKTSQHVLRKQPGDDLLDVLCRIVMPGIDQDFRLRTGRARQQKRHAPIGDVGVVEGRFKWFVLNQKPLLRRQGAVRTLSASSLNHPLRCRMFAVPG